LIKFVLWAKSTIGVDFKFTSTISYPVLYGFISKRT